MCLCETKNQEEVSNPFGELLTARKNYRAIWGIAVTTLRHIGEQKRARSFSDRSFFMDVRAGCPCQKCFFSWILRAWPKLSAGGPQGYPPQSLLIGLIQTSPEVRQQFRRKLRQLHSGNRWCLRIGLLRTFWERDRVLRSLFRCLCVQGALSCPTRRAFLCTLYTCTRKAPNGHSKNLLKSTRGS